MRKKLDTRFPAARIKKIMQADEDVGKIAMAVPVLVSKALELFLQDLCDRTYDITLQRGAKTVSSLHLKHCVEGYNVFDFLREVVSKVPDYGHSDTSADMSKRRKILSEEYNDDDEELRKNRMEICHSTSSGRGRGRRGRGRGRSNRMTEREPSRHENESEFSISIQQSSKQVPSTGSTVDNLAELESPKNNVNSNVGASALGNFDLNSGIQDGADKKAAIVVEPSTSSVGRADTKGEEYPGWSLSEMDRMAIDPLQMAHLNSGLDEEEDYDEEG